MSSNGTIDKFLAALARLDDMTHHGPWDSDTVVEQLYIEVMRLLFEIGTKKLKIPMRKLSVFEDYFEELTFSLEDCVNRQIDHTFTHTTIEDACMVRSAFQFLAHEKFGRFDWDGTYDCGKGLGLDIEDFENINNNKINIFDEKLRLYYASVKDRNPPVKVSQRTRDMTPESHWWWRL